MRGGALALRRIGRIMRQAAQALNAAHDKGVWHLDLKPSNIIVQRSGDGGLRVCLIDFGMARIVSNPGTLTGSIGVIMSFPNTEELFRKVGVRLEVVKTGKFKDVGSIWRPMTRRTRCRSSSLASIPRRASTSRWPAVRPSTATSSRCPNQTSAAAS